MPILGTSFLVANCCRPGEAARNINLHGAVLHVIGDLVQSLGVAVAGAVIWIKQARNLLLAYSMDK